MKKVSFRKLKKWDKTQAIIIKLKELLPAVFVGEKRNYK